MNSELILAALKYTPEEAYNLAKEKGERMPELESIIATDPYWAYYYAINIVREDGQKRKQLSPQIQSGHVGMPSMSSKTDGLKASQLSQQIHGTKSSTKKNSM